MPAGLGHLLGYVPPAGAAFHRERHRPGYRWVEPGQPVGQVFPVGRGAVHHRLAFSNNTAEQAVRMVKSKTRVSGGFRTLKGAQIFLAVRGYISTIRKTVSARLPNCATRSSATHGCPQPPQDLNSHAARAIPIHETDPNSIRCSLSYRPEHGINMPGKGSFT
jgi:hypothetical protein